MSPVSQVVASGKRGKVRGFHRISKESEGAGSFPVGKTSGLKEEESWYQSAANVA